MKGPNPVWISARKKLNQSRPRARAGAAAVVAAGAVTLRGGGDATSLPARRPSRPPSNSSASVDRPWSPPPLGIHGVGHSAECPAAPGLPLIAPIHRWADMPSPVSRSCAGSETGKAAILRTVCEFHRHRYQEDQVPRMELPRQADVGRPLRLHGRSYLRSRIAAIALTWLRA